MNNQTIFKLKQLRLNGMADVYQDMTSDRRKKQSLSVDEILELMVDREVNRRQDSKHERLLKQAAFEQPQAHISDIDYSDSRMLDRSIVLRLASCDFIGTSRNVVIMGATGSGKSYLACAVGREACRQLYSVRFTRMRSLLEDLKMASELREQKIKKALTGCNLLIIDDWMLAAIDEAETALLYEIIHDRELTDRTSTILCTQYDLKGCAMKMAGQTMSDAIYDRLENNAYVINLSQNLECPSMREKYGSRLKPL